MEERDFLSSFKWGRERTIFRVSNPSRLRFTFLACMFSPWLSTTVISFLSNNWNNVRVKWVTQADTCTCNSILKLMFAEKERRKGESGENRKLNDHQFNFRMYSSLHLLRTCSVLPKRREGISLSIWCLTVCVISWGLLLESSDRFSRKGQQVKW